MVAAGVTVTPVERQKAFRSPVQGLRLIPYKVLTYRRSKFSHVEHQTSGRRLLLRVPGRSDQVASEELPRGPGGRRQSPSSGSHGT
jgi:hypothetical protein